MKTKREVIQAEYGEYWEEVKDHVDSNGCLTPWYWRAAKNYDSYLKMVKDLNIIEFKHTFFGPSSLKGIENNNGWLPIPDSLPKGNYLFGNYKDGEWQQDQNYIYGPDSETLSLLRTCGATHYQPVVKRLPPLYEKD